MDNLTIDLATLVGRFIHHCGALEHLTNNAIKNLSSDSILATEAIKSSFSKRIELLSRLLRDRSNLNNDDIDYLYNELNAVRKKRNIVAHNPIAFKDTNQTSSEVILIVRHKPEGTEDPKEMSCAEVACLVEKTSKLILRFVELIPDATKA